LVVDPSVGHIVTTLPAPHVHELGFSPRGTYIITWQRSSKDEKGDAVKNLKVWRTINKSAGEGGEREVVGQFVQKNQTGWNPQYTSDEQFCARVVTNEVQFYQSEDLATVWNKLRVEGVTDFAVAPGEEHSVAVFVPERMVRETHWAAFAGTFIYTGIRANQQLLKSSMSPNSMHPGRRRHFSKGTKCS